jgi:hypothetical protein
MGAELKGSGYFADYRFSEDLDFTLREALPFEEIRAPQHQACET